MSTDVDDYSVIDLLSILNITDPTIENVSHYANEFIARYAEHGPTPNKLLLDFFIKAKKKVLDYYSHPIHQQPVVVENDATEPIKSLWTEKINEIDTFYDDTHIVLEQNQTMNEAAVIPVIATHIVNIDSQYRTNILPYEDNPFSNAFNTNFTFNLNNPITKAVSLTLYSYQIPTTWYAFDSRQGNTFFIYNGVILNIPDGNYTPEILVRQLNDIAALDISTRDLVVSYDRTKNRISLTNNNTLSENVTVVFFVQANVVNFNNCSAVALTQFQTLGINTTLGWLMGFRTPADPTTGDVYVTINSGDTVYADVQPDTYGPKYFILSLEDYSNQRLTSGLYNITSTKETASISIPDFYKTTRAACRLREGSLTQAEIYTLNAVTNASVVNNNFYGFSNKLSGPNSGSAFALIPLQGIPQLRPDPYIRFGADVALYRRNYMSPTFLQRLTVRLTDDKGNLVNLYDNDWSFSLLVEERLN